MGAHNGIDECQAEPVTIRLRSAETPRWLGDLDG
jgi:hypothetical protein